MVLRMVLLLVPIALMAQDGARLFQDLCASCHSDDRLRGMTAERVLGALESGPMLPVARTRSAVERRAIAEFASGKSLAEPLDLRPRREATCGTDNGTAVDVSKGPVWNGWGAGLVNARYQTAAGAGLSALTVPRLKLKWAFAFPGDITSNAQAAVANGRLFAGSQTGMVYSLNATSGCIHWMFQAEGRVQAAVSIGRVPTVNGPRDLAFVADSFANVYALEAATGRIVWRTKVDSHPVAAVTGSPVYFEGRLYVPVALAGGENPGPGFRGSLVALDAAVGRQVWKTYTNEDPGQPGAAISSSPAIDAKAKAVYVTTGSEPRTPMSGAFLALDLQTGKILWTQQAGSDLANAGFVASPMLITFASGKRALVAGQRSGIVYAVDPDRKGALLWQTRIGKGGPLGGIEWGSATDSQNIYAALSDYEEGDGRSGGGLVALRLADGKRVWAALPSKCGTRPRCSPAQSAAVSAIPGVVFSGSMDGHLRAYSSLNGKVLWDVDTAEAFQTVNDVPGRGGSLDGPGPVIAGGMVYVNSGHALTGGKPGNVLLAFSVDGK